MERGPEHFIPAGKEPIAVNSRYFRPASRRTPSVSIAEAARRTTLTLKVKHARRTSLRLRLFSALLRFAAWVAPTTTTIDVSTED